MSPQLLSLQHLKSLPMKSYPRISHQKSLIMKSKAILSLEATTHGSLCAVTDVLDKGILPLDVPKKGSQNKKFFVPAAITMDTVSPSVSGRKKFSIKSATTVARRATLSSNAPCKQAWHLSQPPLWKVDQKNPRHHLKQKSFAPAVKAKSS